MIRILAVDDEKPIAELLRLSLKQAGYECICAYDGIRAAINEKTKLITIQRSKGYATRPTFSVTQIGELIAFCKQIKPDVIVMVDN